MPMSFTVDALIEHVHHATPSSYSNCGGGGGEREIESEDRIANLVRNTIHAYPGACNDGVCLVMASIKKII
jgi:hypothetical protein